MPAGTPYLSAHLFALAMAIGFLDDSSAQEEGGEESGASVQLRVLCSEPVEGATEVRIAQADAVLQELSLVPAMVSDLIGVARGELVLARQGGEAEGIDPVLRLRLPEAGNRFVLALFPAAEGDAKAPYQHVLIRTDGVRFASSDLYLFNLTGVPVGGSFGTKRFALQPGGSEVVTPVPEIAGERMYQARLYHVHEGQESLFSDTRWPVAASARVYLFFVPDPRRRSISYVSFREYQPFE